jgi:hypothetical protein
VPDDSPDTPTRPFYVALDVTLRGAVVVHARDAAEARRLALDKGEGVESAVPWSGLWELEDWQVRDAWLKEDE